MKTNVVETVTHDVLIFGTGLAGLRAAVEIARKSKDSINVALVSKVQIQRPHSVCAEGGTAAVMREEDGDNLELHAWDTVKGADFLADQDVVYKFVERAPKEIRLLIALWKPARKRSCCLITGGCHGQDDPTARSCSVLSEDTLFRELRWERTKQVPLRCRPFMTL